MSDDEFYAASPYDEYEDLWDDDQPLELADDLTQRVAYSPVYQDNPQGELELYHSDWEWYSDDYYDDDPSLVIQNTLDGGGTQIKLVEQISAKRGRKRKLDEARENTKLTEHNALVDTIRGTVWATGDLGTNATFHQGEQDKVALLTNWRDLFIQENGKTRTFGKGQLRRDESWANDMSLADMGLLNERKRSLYAEDAQADAEDEDTGEQNEYYYGQSGGLVEDASDNYGTQLPGRSQDEPTASEQIVERSAVYTNPKLMATDENGNASRQSKPHSQDSVQLSSRKRRRASSISKSGISRSVNGDLGNEGASTTSEIRPTRKKQMNMRPVEDRTSANVALNSQVKSDMSKGRKRKLSEESELSVMYEDGGVRQRPSRKQESSHITNQHQHQETAESEAPPSRRTRSKKK